jgi:SAM-dependent methyltransferase
VGDYEGMYRDCPDPWRIEELGLRLDMRAALLLLDSFPPVARGQGGAVRALDAGAGAGLFSLEVYEALNRRYPAVEMTLNDISPTALAKARARFVANAILPPEILAYDLRRLAGNPASGSPAASVSPAASPAPAAPPPSGPLPPIFSPDALDLIVLAQGLWGIVDGLAGVMRAFRRALGEAGTLLVSQHFPGLENQSWGREVAAPADMADVLRGASFELIAELETGRSVNHHWGSLWRSI